MNQDSSNQPTAGSDVFISYASQDAAVANSIVENLEQHGLKCWIAPRDVRPGTVYADAIVGAINGAKCLVLVLSASAMASAHVGREVERAASKRRQIIAFRMDDAPLSQELEYFLSNSQWIEVPSLRMAAALTKLKEAVRQGSSSATPGISLSSGRRGGKRIAIAAAVIVALGVAVVLGVRFWPSNHGAEVVAIHDKSIAVLPFVDMSEKKDQEYFGDGMAEEIIDLLVRIPGLKVIGRTSSFQFKGKTEDLRAIGTTLGVAYVLEGSVRKSGDRLRVTAQLINSRDGIHAWSGTFERPIGDALKMQDEIAANLARALQISLGANELGPRPTLTSIESYELYLRGLRAVDQIDEAGFQEAIGHFQQAIDLDPHFAPAVGWLAMSYDMQGEWGFVAPGIAFENARRAAQSALKIDPQSFLPYVVLASIHQVYDWDWAAGDAALKRALTLAPREPLVHFFAARYSMMEGRLDDALAHIQTTLARDPLMPTAYVGLFWIQQRRGHLQEAEAAVRRALEISPNYVSAHLYLGLVLLARGERQTALEAMRQETPLGGQQSGLAITYFALGRRAESDAALSQLIKDAAGTDAFGIAEVYAYRGELDQALKWLQRAYTQRDPSLYLIKGEPAMQSLEGDSRYKAFLRKMNLPD